MDMLIGGFIVFMLIQLMLGIFVGVSGLWLQGYDPNAPEKKLPSIPYNDHLYRGYIKDGVFYRERKSSTKAKEKRNEQTII